MPNPEKSRQNEEIIHDMSVICILVATGMCCPPQGNPEPGIAGDHNKDVRGEAGEPRLELVSGK